MSPRSSTDPVSVRYCAQASAGLRPEPELTVSEWAEQKRFLPKSASAEPGKWRNARTPYLREIMDCLSPFSPVTDVVFRKPAQIGGTECGNNWTGFVIDQAPGPMMFVEPTVELAKRLSKQRLQTMIDETPVLRDKVQSARQRDSGNTILAKEFPGGLLIMTGANSAAGLRSMPARYLFLDEIDAYPFDVDEEGDPISLAEARQTTFARRKCFKVSTPLMKGTSRIEAAYNESDQRRYRVPCPFCQHEQVLRWSGIVFEHTADYRLTGEVFYRCEACDELLEERHKTWMLEHGRWVADNPGPDRAAGFHLSALYSPLGWKSWRSCVHEFLLAKKTRDITRLKSWTNTVMAETWEEKGVSIDEKSLLSRPEDYGAEVPAGGLVLTLAADIQSDRIESEVVAWGMHDESWLIEYNIFRGNPETDSSVWEALAGLLDRTWQHASGVTMRVASACIDSGHATKQVYAFARTREHRRVFAVKGMGGKGLPIIRVSEQRNRAGIKLALVGVDTAKSLIFSRLLLTDHGPGYMHFPRSVGQTYFEGLTAERKITKKIRGHEIEEWHKIRQRNEPLDCRVYSLAALDLLRIRDWKRLQAQFEARAALQKPAVENQVSEKGNAQVDSQTLLTRRGRFVIGERRGFVNRY